MVVVRDGVENGDLTEYREGLVSYSCLVSEVQEVLSDVIVSRS